MSDLHQHARVRVNHYCIPGLRVYQTNSAHKLKHSANAYFIGI